MKVAILIVQICVSVLLAGSILLQAKGTGLGSAFGETAQYRSKRGVEKLLYRATLVLTAFFLLTSLVSLLVG